MLDPNAIKELNGRIEIVNVIGDYIQLKKSGSEYVACCPFHKEKTPSFSVSSAKGIYKCFGCGAAGDAIEFIKRHKGLNYVETVKLLADKYNVDLGGNGQYEQPRHKANIFPFSTTVSDYFKKRGLEQGTIDHFRITESREWMPKAKRETTTICFNYYRYNELVNIKFLAANKDFKLFGGAELIFYNIDSIINSDYVIIVEGEIDCLTIHQCGFTSVVSVPNGASTGKVDLKYLDNCWQFFKNKEEIIIMTDNDKPGLALREELSKRLGRDRCFGIIYPDNCKDANDILLRLGAHVLVEAIKNKQPLYISDLPKKERFPFEVFDKRLVDSFKRIAFRENIPIDYMGTTALFVISALAGNMYQTELNGSIRNIIYAMLIGPSGVGKTPAYVQLCEKIISPYVIAYQQAHKERLEQYLIAKENARISKQKFEEKEPVFYKRVTQGGTMEGIIANAAKAAPGFGIYYDEGMKMINSPNAFKKDTTSTDFWNEMWNGGTYSELRADDKLSRDVSNTCISVIIGMQTDRVQQIFTPDAISSGLSSRFIITNSDYILLNEDIDMFDHQQDYISDWWREIVIYLFKHGYEFDHRSIPTLIKFTDDAKTAYNDLCKRLITESNINRATLRVGDLSQLMISYDSKLFKYVGRFVSILSILDNYHAPVITADHVRNAEKLYRYYRSQAMDLFNKVNIEVQTQLTIHEKNLLDLLPDRFTSSEARQKCEDLGLSDRFFDMCYTRKFKNGFIKKTGRGEYQKL